MKKVLFSLAVAFVVSLQANAQVQKMEKVRLNASKQLPSSLIQRGPKEMLKASDMVNMSAPRRKVPIVTNDSVLIYARPDGAFYENNFYEYNDKFYYWTKLAVAPWVEYKYAGYSLPSEGVWGTLDWNSDIEDYVFSEADEESVTEDGDYVDEAFPFSMKGYDPLRSLPTLKMDEATFTLGDDCAGELLGFVGAVDNFTPMAVWHNAYIIGHYSDGSPALNPYYWFGIEWDDKGNLAAYNYQYGSFNLDADGDGKYDSKGESVIQYVEKPMSTLYIQDVKVDAVSCFNKALIAPGKTVTLNFRKVNWVSATNANGETVERQEMGDIIDTFTCTADDIIDEEATSNGAFGTLVFSKTVEDEDGGLVKVGVALDDEFIIEITGLSQDGVDVGIAAAVNELTDYYFKDNNVYFTFMDLATGVISDAYSWRMNTGSIYYPAIYFDAIYDGIQIDTELTLGDNTLLSNCNYFVISNEANEEDGLYYAFHEQGFLPSVNTAMPWYDEENGTENYRLHVKEGVIGTDGKTVETEMEYLPDWLVLQADDSQRNIFENNGNYYYGNGMETLYFAAVDLPSNVKGRYVVITIKGKGVEANVPLYISQGDVDQTVLGIGNTTLASKKNYNTNIYNLSGVRVNSIPKGIFIQNGKKFIRK